MDKEELIVKYLDNQLSPVEKNKFEKLLSESEKLQQEFSKYANLKTRISGLQKLDLNPLYFNSLLPRVYDRMQNRARRTVFRNFGYAVAVLAMLMISFRIFNVFYSAESQSGLFQFTDSLSPQEKVELLRTLNDESDIKSLNILYEEYFRVNIDGAFENISNKNEVAEAYNLDITNVEEYISEEEFEFIYKELISTNFLSEEKL